MELEGLSGGFYWEDEGLEEAPYHLQKAFKHVIAHRTQLVVGPENDVGFLESRNFDKKVFHLAIKYFPDWIGFDESRCTYDPILADRMMRIKKVADYRFEKLLEEGDK